MKSKAIGIFLKAYNDPVYKHQARYDPAAIASLDAHLQARALMYLANKKLFDENISESKKKVTFISTPHPIGNLRLEQSLILDALSKIIALEYRVEQSNEKRNRHNSFPKQVTRSVRNLVYTAPPKQPKKIYTPNDIAVRLQRYVQDTPCSQLANFYQSADIGLPRSARDTTTFSAQTKNLTKEQIDEKIRIIKNELATAFLMIPLPTKVVTPQAQTEIGAIRDRRLQAVESKSHPEIITWNNVDADGDNHPMAEVIDPIGIGHAYNKSKGKNFLEIFLACHPTATNLLGKKKPTLRQPRISWEDKKGITGVKSSLAAIPGVKDITSWNNLLDDAKFNAAYNAFTKFLTETNYKGKVNEPLDFVLRLCSPLFVPAHGLVISDFDASDKTAMPKLRFMLMAATRFLESQNLNTQQKLALDKLRTQVVMPLCENKESIERAPDRFKEFLEFAANKGKSQPEKVKELLSSDGKNLFYGCFVGPSDLTKDMGGRSIEIIQETIDQLRKHWDNFRIHHRNLCATNMQMQIEFGKGTSPKRGGGYTINAPQTLQGVNFATTDTALTKSVVRTMRAQNSGVRMKAHNKALREDAVKFHKYLWDEKTGILTKEFDHLRNAPQLRPLLSMYSNNMGTRGSSVSKTQVEYNKQRAIACAAITSYMGLLGYPSFPAPNGHDSILRTKYNIDTALGNPTELHILMGDLFQIVCLDPNRARALGVKDGIAQSCAYATNLLAELGMKAGFGDTRPQGEDFSKSVEQLVTGLIKKAQGNIMAQNALTLFKAQIPVITKLRDSLTSAITSAKDFSPTTCANIALLNNFLANFQMPLIPAKGFDLSKISEPLQRDRRYWAEKLDQAEQVKEEKMRARL